MIIGICGPAGSGKDTAGEYLVKNHGFVRVALADPLKRICKEVFNFSDEQLWGPSEMRNKPDERYPRPDFVTVGPAFSGPGGLPMHRILPNPPGPWLTPRHALQQLGTEWGRNCYENVWVDYALRIARELLVPIDDFPGDIASYDPKQGIEHKYLRGNRAKGVVITDVRFRNEVEAIKKAGGYVLRIERPGAGLTGAAGAHASESEMREIPDDIFDARIDNNGTLKHLYTQMGAALEALHQKEQGK